MDAKTIVAVVLVAFIIGGFDRCHKIMELQ